MPKIQLYTDQIGQNTPQPSQGSANVSGLTAGIDAIGQLAQVGADVAAKVEQNQRHLKAASMTTKASMELKNYVFDLKNNDRDYATKYDRYVGFVDNLSKEYQENMKDDPESFSMFKQNIDKLAFDESFDVRSNSLSGQMDAQRGDLTLNMANLAELAVQGDAEQQEQVKQKANYLLDQSYGNGVIDGKEYANLSLKFSDDLVSAQVRYDIIDDPDNAADKLLKGEYSGLSNERQMVWLEKANQKSEARQRMRFAEEDRGRREQERREMKISEDLAKSGDELLYTGNMNAEWLEENRDGLTDSDYRYFYKAMTTGSEGFTDVNIYSSLRFRASEGEDVRQEARSYLHKGMLKLGDYDKLINRSEQNAGGASVPNWFKRGEKYLSDTFRVSDINPDPASSQRRANVLDEWSQWALENTSPEPEQARKAYQEIAKSYALIDSSEMLLIKPLPRFGVGNRQALDIDSTIKFTVEAYQSGEITEDEFMKQSLLIKEWEKGMQKLRSGDIDNAK